MNKKFNVGFMFLKNKIKSTLFSDRYRAWDLNLINFKCIKFYYLKSIKIYKLTKHF